MRNNYLLLTLITLILLSCKKETKEIISNPPAESVDGGYIICTDDKWVSDIATQENEADLVAVYNNKVYFFHNNWNLPSNDPRRRKIRIFDGTSWEIKSSDIPFEPLYIGFSFVIGNKGYFGYTTYVGSSSHGQTWQYNFTTNNWSTADDFPAYYLTGAAYFTVGNKGYVVGGQRLTTFYPNINETWEFNPSASNQWTQKADFPGVGRLGSEGFTIENKGYIVAGKTALPHPYEDIYNKALFEYNPANNTWVIKTPFPGAGREFPKSFVINGKAYVGGGFVADGDQASHFYDFYQYDPADNDWTTVDYYSSGGKLRKCYSINSKGYAVWKPNNDVFADPLKMKKYTPQACTTGGPTLP
jgi:N-acetylneuraminic acid mutarotase